MAKKSNTSSSRTVTYMEPRKMRRATTGLDDGGFYVVEVSPSYSKKKDYRLGYKRHAHPRQYLLKKQYGAAISEHTISKAMYDAFIKEAKKQWRKHADVREPGEQITTTTKY